MKKLLAWVIPVTILTLFSCNDEYEVVNTYRQPYIVPKSYPIYLNTKDILKDPQILASRPSENTFKIVADDKYIFVGEKKKGIHVYSRQDATHAQALCFIECKEIKALELKDHLLYCNNFVDLLVLDVQNPLQAKLLLREKEFFNKYDNPNMNAPKYAGVEQQYIIGYKKIVIYGVATQDKPEPDFKEYDELYSNIVVNEIPDSLSVPVVGLVKTKNDIYTYGQSSLASCVYNSGKIYTLAIPQTYWSAEGGGKGLTYSNGIVFSAATRSWSGYACDTDWIFSSRYIYWYYYDYSPTDFVYMPAYNTFVFIARESWLYVMTGLSGSNYSTTGSASGGGRCLALIRDRVISLGDNLMVYNVLNRSDLKVEKTYSDINGSCLLSYENTLIVSNKSGLFFYDVSDLNNIKQIK